MKINNTFSSGFRRRLTAYPFLSVAKQRQMFEQAIITLWIIYGEHKLKAELGSLWDPCNVYTVNPEKPDF